MDFLAKLSIHTASHKFPAHFVNLTLLITVIFLSLQGTTAHLVLTPYIQSGFADEARNLSRVRNISEHFDIEIYSGFITVNEDYNANIFFWYFPPIASNDTDSAPVILWLEGGPGVSVQSAVFNEHGPFIVQDDLTLKLRKETWASTNHMIYIDSPAGVGFSYIHSIHFHYDCFNNLVSTESETGYNSNCNETANDTYEFLIQFFTLFPFLVNNPFYVAGHSFGGHFAPALAYKIHTENLGVNPHILINMKGLVLEAPWTDARTQVYGLGDNLYHHGFIDEITKDYIDEQVAVVCKLMDDNKHDEALKMWEELYFSPTSFVHNVTAFELATPYNYYEDLYIPSHYLYRDFLDLNTTKKAIHVGNYGMFGEHNEMIYKILRKEILSSYRKILEVLLDAPQGYKVVLYVGQMDIWTSFLGLENMIRNMRWSGNEEFHSSVRKTPWPWVLEISDEYRYDYCAGYAKTLGNFTYVMVRNAGHLVSKDKTGWTLDLINRVTRNIPFY